MAKSTHTRDFRAVEDFLVSQIDRRAGCTDIDSKTYDTGRPAAPGFRLFEIASFRIERDIADFALLSKFSVWPVCWRA
jgi:hypothetical protein